MNLHHHTKNQAISFCCSRDIVDLKILQSDWLRPFWLVSQQADFSQAQDFCRNIGNNITFHYRSNSGKTNDQMFHSKDLFFTHFPHSFQRSWALACKTPYRFLVPCQSDFGAGGHLGGHVDMMRPSGWVSVQGVVGLISWAPSMCCRGLVDQAP